MGTRSTITFIGKTGNEETPYIKIYQQYDGYIDGVGHDLARFLVKRRLINGIQNETMEEAANGIGCLIAQYISVNKNNIGDLYIEPLNSSNEWTDYNYTVVIDEDKIPCDTNEATIIKVTNFDNPEIIFEGKPSELLKFDENEEDEENEEEITMTHQEARELEAKCEKYLSDITGEKCTISFTITEKIRINFLDSYIVISKDFTDVEYFDFTRSFSTFKDIVEAILDTIQKNFESMQVRGFHKASPFIRIVSTLYYIIKD